MDMKKRRDMQLLYVTDEAIMEEQSVCRKKLQKLNSRRASECSSGSRNICANRWRKAVPDYCCNHIATIQKKDCGTEC